MRPFSFMRRHGAPGEASARLKFAWNEGLARLHDSPSGSRLPWLLSFGHNVADRELVLSHAGATVPDVSGYSVAAPLVWRFADEAVWIDSSFVMDPNATGYWRAFLSLLRTSRQKIRLAGAVAFLDAGRLVTAGAPERMLEAALVRSRLDELRCGLGRDLPAYLVVDRMDRLYGARSFASALPPERLDAPFGAFRDNSEEPPGLFVEQALDRAVRDLSRETLSGPPAESPARAAAAVHAPAELDQLRDPLSDFAVHAFGAGPHHVELDLRGIFLISGGPSGKPLPPLAPFAAAMPNCGREPEQPGRPWFLPRLLASLLPRHAVGHSAGRNGRNRVAAASLALCTLVLGGMVGASFWKAGESLRALEGVVARPASESELRPYLDRILRLEAANESHPLPWFGMVESLRAEAELRRRYHEAAQELTRRAPPALPADSAQPVLATPPSPPPVFAFEPEAASAPVITAERKAPRPEAVAPAAEQPTAPVVTLPTRDDVNDLFQALSGPADRLPAVPSPPPPARPRSVPENTEQTGVRTRAAAYSITDADRSERFRLWKEKADSLWTGRLAGIDDRDIPRLIREAATGSDPVTLLLVELRDHVLPLYRKSDPDPDMAWLRLYVSLLPASAGAKRAARSAGSPISPVGWTADRASESSDMELHAARLAKAYAEIGALCASPAATVELVREKYRGGPRSNTPREWPGVPSGPYGEKISGDPFGDAQTAAEALARVLRDASGSRGWANLSPVASYHYLRYLATRLAAVRVEERWRDSVYHASPVIRPVGDSKTKNLPELMNEFLAETSGFWISSGGGIRNASWGRMPFMFTREFLALCDTAVAFGDRSRPQSVVMPFLVDAVLVDADALERPTRMEFLWGGEKIPRKLEYRNYSLKDSLSWDMNTTGSTGFRIHFPSFTLTRIHEGVGGLGKFVRMFERGGCVLHAEEFPESAEALAEMGISAITLRGELLNVDEFLLYYENSTIRLPESIITGGRSRSGDATSSPASGKDETLEKSGDGMVTNYRTAHFF